MPVVKIPAQLRTLSEHMEIALSGRTLSETLSQLALAAPLLATELFDQNGELRAFIALFVDGKRADATGSPDLPVSERTQITLLMAAAGG